MQYKKAPLPFQGQKRNFLNQVKAIDFSNMVVIDLFGGSGLLSHTIKQSYPSALVIYNDFDNYEQRLRMINQTEQIRCALYAETDGVKNNTATDEMLKKRLINIIQQFKYVDTVTLSSWLLFSGNYAHTLDDLVRQTWYVRIPETALCADGYLTGIERVQGDFREVFDQFKNQSNLVWVVDPPYLMTDQNCYRQTGKKYFKLRDAIDLMLMLRNQKFVLFSSEKSETDILLELCGFSDIQRFNRISSSGSKRSYIEYLYKINMESLPM